jgi:uncharacterized protein YjiS (DUF1127 family)
MSTIYVPAGVIRSATPLRRAVWLFEKYFSMFCEWQQRAALRGALYGMTDRELQDIGTSRGEIDYVVRDRSVDPRRGRSA